MSSKKLSSTIFRKRVKKRQYISLEIKMEVLKRFAAGESISKVSRDLGLARSTVSTIKSNQDKIILWAQRATPNSRKIASFRHSILEQMERVLNAWIEDHLQRNIPITVSLIREKARSFYKILQTAIGDDSGPKPFFASNGWFHRFKKRYSLDNIKLLTENLSSATDDLDKYLQYLKSVIREGCYLPEQVFRVNETNVFWKSVPSKSFLSQEELAGSEFRAFKDRLTLLLGGNASGDFKLKPLLIYHLDNPLSKVKDTLYSLPVTWRTNKSAWMTTSIFQEWFVSFFCPAVGKYCAKKQISPKCLLIVDEMPGHPGNLDELSECVRVVYIPKSISALLQHMDQGVVANFQAFYMRGIFRHLIKEVEEGKQSRFFSFWKNFTLIDAVEIMADTWEEVSGLTLNHMWKNIWPECIFELDDFSHPEIVDKVYEDIIKQANTLGLEGVDVVEFLQDDEENLSNFLISDLLRSVDKKPSKLVDNAIKTCKNSASSIMKKSTIKEEYNGPCRLTTNQMSEAFSLIDEGLRILTENDSNEDRSLRVSRNVQNSIMCYKTLYKKKAHFYNVNLEDYQLGEEVDS